MKNATAKLKNMNYKQFAIDHLEKMVFGLFALIALLSLFGSRWAGYNRAPEELQQETDKAKKTILASTWPEEKKKAFEVGSNIAERVRTLVTGVDSAKWAYGNEGPSWPLIKRKKPIEEPTWLAVQDLRAKPGRFILSLLVEEEYDPAYDPYLYPEGEEMEEYDPRFAPRTGIGAGAGAGPAGAAGPGVFGPGPGMGSKGGDPRGRGGRPAVGPAAGPAAGGPLGERGGRGGRGSKGRKGGAGKDDIFADAGRYGPGGTGMMPMAGGLGGMAGLQSMGKGRGVRYVAVRGVFPIMDQREKIADASNQVANPQMEFIEFLDFELQRQHAVLGEEQWSPWETLKIKHAKDVLAEASDFDPDVVESAITDNVFTMPLPARGAGWWTEDVASHPQVRNYQLSPEEMEREIEINRKLIEQYEQMEQLGGKRFTAKPGGFADSVLDIRGIRSDVAYGLGTGGNDFYSMLEQELDPDKREKALAESIKERVQAQGRVLLFRYFDFDVVPDNVYRYRVKLTVRNPNFERSLTEVIDPSVIEGETRETPWSAASNPSYVEKDVKYFMQNVQIAGRTTDGAIFDIYQWFADSGTFINKTLKVKFGQIIGGKETAKVLRPLEQKFEDEDDVMFDSGDLLVDARDAITLNREEHPDLQLTAKQRGQVGIIDRALIMNRYGELASVDPISTTQEHKKAKDLLQLEQTPYEAIKDAIKLAEQAEQEGSDLDALARPGMEGATAPGYGSGSGKKGRGKNPLRMGRGGMGDIGGAGPGMGGPGPGMGSGGRGQRGGKSGRRN